MKLKIAEGNLEAIVEGCRKHDERCFKKLYELYSRQMAAICYRYCNNYDTATDLMHDGFIRAFKYIKNYRGDGNFEGWLKKIFVNISLDYVKKEINQRDRVEFDYLDNTTKHSECNYSEVDVEYIFEAINQLPHVARTIFNMFNLDGYSIEQITEELKMSSAAVRSQHSRAKAKLQQILKKHL